MICPDCGHEVTEGLACPVCGPALTDRKPRQCGGCGTTYFGEFCPGCAIPEENEETAWERERQQERTATSFCTQCGNEIPQGEPCPICAAKWARPRPEPDPVAVDTVPILRLCPGCGNEVEDIHRCPICAHGAAHGTKPPPDPGPLCPRCDQMLEEQQWDDVRVMACASCHGVQFPPNGLRRTLTRLREEADPDEAALAEERTKNLHAALPDKVRYKRCPVCKHSMNRRNFASLSGIILDVCGQHGTWVDSAVFERLAALASRGVEV
jgi:Zn-finger nucleic acid-binding protein